MPSAVALGKAFVLVCVGLLAVGGGVALASLGYSQYGKCGAQEITVTEVPAGEVDSPEEYTPFESLTADQQAAFERALETGEATLFNRSGFPKVAYEGSYYTAQGPEIVCDFDPATVMGLGGGSALLGVLALVWAFRRAFSQPSAGET